MSRLRSRTRSTPTAMRTLAGVMLALGDQSFMGRRNGFEVLGENANRPSIQLDPNPKTFVEQKSAIIPPEGGRNAPCSCRSGKKFKKCCGKAPSYEIDSHGNHRISTTKSEEAQPKVKELNFQNLAGLDDAAVAAHFPEANHGSQAESSDTPVGNDNGEGNAKADGGDVHSVPAGV